MGRTISHETARRLAIASQGLAGEREPADDEGLRRAITRLGCLQLDPTSAVAPSHRLVVWSRVGQHEYSALDLLAYRDRWMLEGAAHEASFVLDDDAAIHQHWCRARRRAPRPRTAAWLHDNRAFVRRVLAQIERHGPIQSRDIDESPQRPWPSGVWTSARNVALLLEILLGQGRVMVGRRESGQRLWDLPERCLRPADIERPGTREVVRRSVLRALGALGVARADHIQAHFTRSRYPDLAAVLAGLVRAGRVQATAVGSLPGAWYVATETLPLLEQIEVGWWQPRATLLSPFDNLLCDRSRAEVLFDFHHRLEIYVPPAKRRWGYWVMPFLDGDRLVGRVDLVRDRPRGESIVNQTWWEPGCGGRTHRRALDESLGELSGFVGARPNPGLAATSLERGLRR